MTAGIKKDNNWRRFQNMLDPRNFQSKLNRVISLATRRAAQYVVGEIRASIQRNEYEPLSGLAIVSKAKTSSLPLVDAGSLWLSITDKAINPFTAFVGVLRQAKGKRGKNMYNIAMVLHEGAVIQVTPKMRAYFWYRHNEDPRWLPLNPTTTAIFIPPRPFIRQVVEKPHVKQKVWAEWRKGMRQVLRVA